MGSLLSKPESGFRKSISKRVDKFIKPRPSGQTTPAPALSTSSFPHPVPTPDPNADSTVAPGHTPLPVTPRLSAPAPTTPARAPSPAPSTFSPANPTTEPPSAPAPEPAPFTSTTGVWAVLETSLRALHKSTKVFPPVQSAVGLFIACLDVMQQLSENHDERKELASELTRLSNLMVRHMERSNSTRMSDAFESVARGIREQVMIIESRRNRGAGWRLFEASADEEVISRCYRRIGSLFRELQADASMSVWKVVSEQMANSQLDRLSPVLLAKYDSALSTSISRRTCTANTRTAILSGLNRWSYDANQADIYWMNGMAGTGKTTIACTFAESLRQRERLAASFFCTRTVPECRAATRILPTIAYQIARYSPQFRSALCESLQEDPDVGTTNLTTQFDLLLKEPLIKVKGAIPSRLVIVIDALDECDDMRQVELLLRILLKGAKYLPIRFFITSRPEPEVYSRMMLYDHGSRGVLHLHEVEGSLVQADIDLYLREELAPMSPKATDIQELVERSGTLFIYAATLVRYIDPDNPINNPARRLQSVLSVTSTSAVQYSAIDTLYSVVLRAALDRKERDAAEVEEVRRVLRTVVCAQEPLSMESLTVVAKLDDKAQTLAALQRLRAVVHVSESTGLVSTLHASFPDFMFAEARSRSYHCNLAAFSQDLAQRCFELMESMLRFNICNLESSFLRDNEVGDLDEKITRTVSPVLWYACQYWGDHLEKSNYSDSLCSDLEGFLANRLLFWVEVMNLKRKIGIGLEILAKARSWIVGSTILSDVAQHVEDSRRFVSGFAANPVSQSTPHIYLSSLPFCPKSSFVFRQYYKMTKGLINVAGSVLEQTETTKIASWTVESEVYCIAPSPDGRQFAYGCKSGVVAIRSSNDGILVVGPVEGHTKAVKSIAFSTDGSRIITGSADKSIRIWNTQNGALATGPLEGHFNYVVSVAFSPDGTQVVSGSNDHTLRVWDAQNGALVAGPLHGHAKGVWAVAYSPDGSRIASGSADNSIRVWDAENGALVIGPLEGHTGSVRSVAYSPDGAHITSGSYDKAIRVWNANDGTLVAGPLRGHTDSVRSVAYSPDSIRIVSGSSDNTIRVWNAQDGTPISEPLKGHTKGVTSLTYSSGGTRIISGSYDSTIRVWDPQGGTSVTKKFDSHTGSICSVAYSPDGTRIVSGSNDHTIRIWHAQSGSLVAGPLEGHTDAVKSVAYSPDGTRIVSGSGDCTIRVWNAQNGTLAVGPLEGHIGPVRSVGYSHDGTRIVSSSSDETIRVWNAEDGTLVSGPFMGHTGPVMSVVYSPDGTRIASGSYDGTVRVWNTQDGSFNVGLLEGHSGDVNSVAYSPDGTRIASGSDDKTIRVWSAKDGTLVAGPFKSHASPISSVAYSPDGTRIVSGSWDKTICIWNAEDGTLVAGPLNGHTEWIRSVAYSPDGTCVVTGSDDQTIRVWSARDGAPDLSLHPNPETMGPIADGASTDVSGWVTASDGRLLFWTPLEVQPRDMLSQLRCQLAIGHVGTILVEYGDFLLGRRWSKCYQP